MAIPSDGQTNIAVRRIEKKVDDLTLNMVTVGALNAAIKGANAAELKDIHEKLDLLIKWLPSLGNVR